MDSVKLCLNCKYEKRDWLSYVPILGTSFRRFSKCSHPNFIETDLITGQKINKSYCSTLRIFECGAQAKYFEPKKMIDKY